MVFKVILLAVCAFSAGTSAVVNPPDPESLKAFFLPGNEDPAFFEDSEADHFERSVSKRGGVNLEAEPHRNDLFERSFEAEESEDSTSDVNEEFEEPLHPSIPHAPDSHPIDSYETTSPSFPVYETLPESSAYSDFFTDLPFDLPVEFNHGSPAHAARPTRRATKPRYSAPGYGSGYGSSGFGPGRYGSGYGSSGLGPGKYGSGYGSSGFGPGKYGSGYGSSGFGPGRYGSGYGSYGYGPLVYGSRFGRHSYGPTAYRGDYGRRLRRGTVAYGSGYGSRGYGRPNKFSAYKFPGLPAYKYGNSYGSPTYGYRNAYQQSTGYGRPAHGYGLPGYGFGRPRYGTYGRSTGLYGRRY